MLDVFDCGAVLYESDEGEEGLRVECAVTPEGALEIVQLSDGPLTAWCFEETPHKIEVAVDPMEVDRLLEYFHIDDVSQLPAMLRMEYTGYDCSQRIRKLMKRLGIAYQVTENQIVR